MSQENGLAKGRVKWFSVEKAFGFITQEGSDKDVFVHASDVPAGVELDTDDEVEFTIEQSKKGLKARNVKLLPQAAS
jgi:CspA family cold shock protein